MSITFNSAVNPKARTELFKIYANVGTTVAPVWELQGRGIESWSVERNEDIEKREDVLGLIDIMRGKQKPTQSGIDLLVRKGSAFGELLMDAWYTGDYSKLDNLDLLHKYEFVDYEEGTTTDECLAKRESECTVVINSFGGEAGGYLGFNIDIHYTNNTVTGHMTKEDASPVVFTPDP